MREQRRIITLTTDFGTQDGYVGAMKGVLLGEAPGATVVDITHDVPPQDVAAGAFALARAAPWFPEGTIHVAVVDPGVGSGRRAVVIEHRGHFFVGPDNGLLTLAAPADRGAVLDRLPVGWRISSTFHGRDVFARAAGRLAAGAPIDDLSSGEVGLVRLEVPEVEAGDDGTRVGAVVHVDRFGNLITNLREDTLEAQAVEVLGRAVACGRTYTDVERGSLIAYVGSAGLVEVAVREGSAATMLGAGRGARVIIRRAT